MKIKYLAKKYFPNTHISRHFSDYKGKQQYNLITDKCAIGLRTLWSNYRASQYYRPYVPTRRSAEQMIGLEKAVNNFIEERL